jgi:hypothetical protein
VYRIPREHHILLKDLASTALFSSSPQTLALDVSFAIYNEKLVHRVALTRGMFLRYYDVF